MGFVLTSLHTPPSVRLCLQLTLGRLLAVLVRYQRLLPDALADGNVDAARLLPADPLALPAALQWLHVALQRAGTGGRMVSATSAARVVRCIKAACIHAPQLLPVAPFTKRPPNLVVVSIQSVARDAVIVSICGAEQKWRNVS